MADSRKSLTFANANGPDDRASIRSSNPHVHNSSLSQSQSQLQLHRQQSNPQSRKLPKVEGFASSQIAHSSFFKRSHDRRAEQELKRQAQMRDANLIRMYNLQDSHSRRSISDLLENDEFPDDEYDRDHEREREKERFHGYEFYEEEYDEDEENQHQRSSFSGGKTKVRTRTDPHDVIADSAVDPHPGVACEFSSQSQLKLEAGGKSSHHSQPVAEQRERVAMETDKQQQQQQQKDDGASGQAMMKASSCHLHHAYPSKKSKNKPAPQLTKEQWQIIKRYYDHHVFSILRSMSLFVQIGAIIAGTIAIISSCWIFKTEIAKDTGITVERSLWNEITHFRKEDSNGSSSHVEIGHMRKSDISIIVLHSFGVLTGLISAILTIRGFCSRKLPRRLYNFHSAAELLFVGSLASSVSMLTCFVGMILDEPNSSTSTHIGYGFVFGLALPVLLLIAAFFMILDDLLQLIMMPKLFIIDCLCCCCTSCLEKRLFGSEFRQV